ncbi:MAG: DUF494 domain-containing protein [FCB group bacterium]|nr:DUF494 domain-containing protein [FCB group bacterium]
MTSRVLEIIVLLMDFMRNNQKIQSDANSLSSALYEMGYSEQEISIAYDWFLEQLGEITEEYYAEFPTRHSSVRLLSATEKRFLTPEAYGFLLKLINHGLLDDEQLEDVIERADFSDMTPVTLEEIKTIASSIVFEGIESPEKLSFFDPIDNHTNIIN